MQNTRLLQSRQHAPLDHLSEGSYPTAAAWAADFVGHTKKGTRTGYGIEKSWYAQPPFNVLPSINEISSEMPQHYMRPDMSLQQSVMMPFHPLQPPAFASVKASKCQSCQRSAPTPQRAQRAFQGCSDTGGFSAYAGCSAAAFGCSGVAGNFDVNGIKALYAKY